MAKRWVPELPDFDRLVEPKQAVRLIHDGEHVMLVELLRGYAEKARGRNAGWLNNSAAATPAKVADFVEVCSVTGLRLEEMLKRQPNDVYRAVDQENRDRWWLRVADSATSDGEVDTKTETERCVILTDEHAALLHARLPWGIHEHNVRYWWDKARAEMGLATSKRFVRHAMRHTVATQASKAGVNAFHIQRMLGHRDIKTTLRYVHVNDGDVAKAGDAVVAFQNARRTQGNN